MEICAGLEKTQIGNTDAERKEGRPGWTPSLILSIGCSLVCFTQ